MSRTCSDPGFAFKVATFVATKNDMFSTLLKLLNINDCGHTDIVPAIGEYTFCQ